MFFDTEKIMGKMTFTTDKRSVTEGDIIEVSWDCTGADSVELAIDNGYKSTTLSLPIDGSKRFRLHRSKGRTRLTITAHVAGKSYSKTIRVKVMEMPVTHAETVDSQGQPMGRLRQWFNLPKWQSWLSRYRQGRQAMSPEKRLASRILLILGLLLLLARVPALFFLGLLGLTGYLVWVLLRR